MPLSKAHIIHQLQKEILSLQGFKTKMPGSLLDVQLGPIKYAFPNNNFPLGAVHEFICSEAEDRATTTAFIAGIASSLMRNNGVSLWIGSKQTLYPPALTSFGIAPEKIIFIELQKEKEILWAMEEALKCSGLAIVVAEIKDLSFTASRRLQLAVEQSLVTGFIIRHNPININPTACVSRWQIKPVRSAPEEGMPGVGYPRWNVTVLKVRNGKGGSWMVEWNAGSFKHIPDNAVVFEEEKKKTG
jgi:protein ImuA